MKAASVTVAHVLLLTVAVATAAALVGMVTGVVGGQGAGRLRVLPDSYILVSDRDYALRPTASLHLHVAVEGGPVEILYVEVLGTGDRASYFYVLDSDAGLREAYLATGGRLSKRLPGGWEGWLIAGLGSEYTPGLGYTVKIYTADGAAYSVTLMARR